ncbi:MAG: ParA family protein [Thermoleophilia bacterium]|nr:ParA family protein [Thermoleophilia bacterium]
MTTVLAFANQKGGVAKTTSTLNVGVALREMHQRVLAIDLDPQANLSMCQGINPDYLTKSMFNVLVQRMSIDDVIHRREIDIAPASIDLAGAELALSAAIGRERSLAKALMEVKQRYDFILVDTPPSLGLLTINAFTAADGVVVPVQCEYLSLRGLAQLERTLGMIKDNLNPDVRIRGILPTMYDRRTLHSREALDILKESFGDLVFKTEVRKTIKFAEAPVQGRSMLSYDPGSRAADTYRKLAKELLNGTQSKHEGRGPGKTVPAYRAV